jgi:starch phosphorylase
MHPEDHPLVILGGPDEVRPLVGRTTMQDAVPEFGAPTDATPLPTALAPLRELAQNLRWCWHRPALEVFRSLDGSLWEQSGHNPVRMLAVIDPQRIEAAAGDPAFVAEVRRQHEDLQAYLAAPAETEAARRSTTVGYFSAEFGITECLPIFAGGLGILAGDHLKASSDLAVPLTGVGLMYREGYFRQRLTVDGHQQELYEDARFEELPVARALAADGTEVTVDVPFPGRTVVARVWTAEVGRVHLHLLDTNDAANDPEDRWIAQHLYGGDIETRLRQEILLGIGGYRALEVLGVPARTFHMNEGHSAFLALEHVRQVMAREGLAFEAARAVAARDLVFTTHTPVEAGHDYFPPELVLQYLGDYPALLGLSEREFLGLGRRNIDDKLEPFCMTVLALRLAGRTNAVSRLHGVVTRRMWHDVFPGVDVDKVPVTHVTNGIHFPSFVSGEQAALYDRWLGAGWRASSDPGQWGRVAAIPDEELWRVRGRRRERLVTEARQRLHTQAARRGEPSDQVAGIADVLDERALTIGFARRFATYKRGALLLSDPERLAKILGDPARPVQVLVAGKAHPRDDAGKQVIRQVATWTRDPLLRRRLVFLEDYDTAVARVLVQGCDVWLNTPRRPYEACGTSGMKSMANGGLNVSTLDGWWDEAWMDRDLLATPFGWAVGGRSLGGDEQRQDGDDAESLYSLLEREIVPMFYDRDAAGLPREWLARMKSSIANLGPVFNAHRMVADYVSEAYGPRS